MSNRVNIYTDGSAIGNPGPGGYGIIMEWVNKKSVSYTHLTLPTIYSV